MSQEDELDDLMLQWEKALEAGQEITADELCQDHPELLEQVRHRIKALKSMGWMTRPEGIQTEIDQLNRPRLIANRYRLDALLGEGGFAQVWRGYDLELQRPVAVKVPKPSRRFSPEEIERFLAEARRVASLRHPGIVAVHDVVRVEGAWVIVADWIDGCDLGERLRQGPLSYEEIIRIVAEVARSLDHAHRQGVIHLDVKPSNVLLDAQGRPLVCDFGIAASPAMAAPGDRIGTLPYCSPEQVRGQPLDARTDIWSLGVLLYAILTGRLPFDTDDPADLRQKITDNVPTSPRAVVQSIPKGLERICLKCLAKRSEGRYPTASALADDLDRCLRTPATRRWLLLVGVLALLLSAAGIVTYFLPGAWTPHPPTVVRRFVVPESHANGLCWSPDGRLLAAGGLDAVVRLWDAESGELVREFRGHECWVRYLAFSPDGRHLLSCSGGTHVGGRIAPGTDHSVRLWSVGSGEEALRLTGHRGPVICAVYSPDGTRILSGSDDGTVRLWEVEAGKELACLEGHRGHVCSVAFSPDGRSALSGGLDRTVRLWDLAAGRQTGSLRGHRHQIQGVAYTGPRSAVSCGLDRQVLVWDLRSEEPVGRLIGHEDTVNSLAVVPPGHRVLSGSSDGSVRLWDVASRRELLRFTTDTVVTSVALAPGGRSCAVASEDGIVRVWRFASPLR